MAINLGRAYVQIVPSARGIGGNIRRELDPKATAAGISAGSRLSAAFSNSLNLTSVGESLTRTGQKLTNFITKPALAATTALVGVTLVKGFQRLTGIDSARAKLTALGHSAKDVEAIMDDALAAVKGTSFGMGEAATTAATAVAAGIKPGKELLRYLTLVGDTAAIAETDMANMGSIFNKVTTSGRVQAMELNQMLDRGIPIIQLLAEEMGVAEDEIRNLASQGKISAEDFLNAVETGFGGAAQIMGELSFTAAWKNVGASIGRIGEAFLDAGGKGGGFFSQMKPLMGEFIEWSDKAVNKAAEWGVKFGKAFAKIVEKVKGVISWFKSLSSEQKKLIGVAAGLAVGMGPFTKILGSIFTKGGKVVGVLQSLGGSIGGVLGSVSEKLGGLGGQLGKVFGFLGEHLGSIGAIGGKFIGLAGTFSVVTLALGGLHSAFGEQIDGMLLMVQEKGPSVIQNFVAGIVEKIPELMEAGTQMITGLLETITVLLPEIIMGGTQILTSLLQGFAEALPEIIPAVFEMISVLLLSLMEALPEIILAGLEVLMALIQGIFENLPLIIETVFEMITTFVEAILENLPTIIAQGIELLMALIQGIIESLPEIVGAVAQMIADFIAAIASNLPQILAQGIKILLELAVGLVKAIPQLIANLPKIFMAIVDAFASHDWAQMGKDIIKGVWNGIKNMGKWLADKVKGFFTGIFDGVKNLFGISSPSKLFADEIGRWIPAGLAVGVESNLRPVKRAMDTMYNETVRDYKADVVLNSTLGNAQLGNYRAAGYEEIVINQNFYNLQDSPRQQQLHAAMAYRSATWGDR